MDGTKPAAWRPRRLLLIAGLAICVAAVLLFALWPRLPDPTAESADPPQVIDLEGTRAKAETGDLTAQRQLGLIYARGQKVKQSYTEAAKWYQLAADKGDPGAQRALGELYEAGQGVPLDNARAAEWYRRAAEQGDTAAQYSLAVLYVTAKGVPRDIPEALRWYGNAAQQGNAMAQYNLGMRHRDGDGVPPNLVEAYKWLSLAAAQGVGDAATARDQLKSRMTRKDIAEGERRTAAFMPQQTRGISLTGGEPATPNSFQQRTQDSKSLPGPP